jgi:hypothetical protein
MLLGGMECANAVMGDPFLLHLCSVLQIICRVSLRGDYIAPPYARTWSESIFLM